MSLIWAVGGIAAVSGVGALVRARPRHEKWARMVEHVADAYRLCHYRVNGSTAPFSDSAEGRYDGLYVTVGVDEEAVGRVIDLGVSADIDADLAIARAGALVGHDQNTPLGVRRFDAAVDIYGGRSHALEQLRLDSPLRRELLSLTARGLTIKHGNASLRTTRFPRRARHLSEQVERIIDVCRRLAELQPGD